jgi:outer membrane lipoprotein-sorting protein
MNKLRRLVMTAPFVMAALSGAAQAQELSLAEISGYFNGLRTAEGDFTQIASDGIISTGHIYIKRPGRIRFDYNPPEEALVIAGGGSVAVFDPRSNTGPDRYPLNQTPLNIILARTVNLDQAEMVTNVISDGTTTTVTAQDPDHPEYGSIRLVFTANPVELRQWIVDDGTGFETTVILGAMTVGEPISESLFNITRATQLWADR